MTRVAHQATFNVVGVFETLEDGRNNWNLRPLLDFNLFCFNAFVQLLDPVMVLEGQGLGDVLLEDDQVGVFDVFAVYRLVKRGDGLVEDISPYDRGSRRQQRECKKTEDFHSADDVDDDDGAVVMVVVESLRRRERMMALGGAWGGAEAGQAAACSSWRRMLMGRLGIDSGRAVGRNKEDVVEKAAGSLYVNEFSEPIR